ATAILNQTGRADQKLKIEDQIYHDIFAKVKLPSSKLLKHSSSELSFGIQNLFNDYTVDMSGTQSYLSKYSDVRGRQYYLNLKFSF
ncbi:TonB-dependent receptor, partial [Acinetobacter gyllenbergii]